MPFTPAHAAAALPFRRTRLIPSALIIGTLAPDFEYFLRMSTRSGFGHTFVGVFTLTLPLALLVLWLYHAYVKVLVLSLLPRGWQVRLANLPGLLEPFVFRGATRFFWILLSILTGIATHIVWDSFTHPLAWPSQHWAFLSLPIPLTSYFQLPLNRFLQHTSTVIGLTILMAWLWRWYRDTPPSAIFLAHPNLRRFSPSRKLFVVAQIVVLASAGAIMRVIINSISPDSGTHPITYPLSIAVCTLIALIWWQLVVYGILSKFRTKALNAGNVRE